MHLRATRNGPNGEIVHEQLQPTYGPGQCTPKVGAWLTCSCLERSASMLHGGCRALTKNALFEHALCALQDFAVLRAGHQIHMLVRATQAAAAGAMACMMCSPCIDRPAPPTAFVVHACAGAGSALLKQPIRGHSNRDPSKRAASKATKGQMWAMRSSVCMLLLAHVLAGSLVKHALTRLFGPKIGQGLNQLRYLESHPQLLSTVSVVCLSNPKPEIEEWQ